MPINTIYPEEPCLLPVQFSQNPLTSYSKTYSDIEDILICAKISASDADNKYLLKYYKDGSGGGSETGDVLLNEATHTFTLNKLETDVLPVNDAGYRLFIGVKVSGLSKWLWLRVSSADVLIVEEDGISV